MKFEELGKLWKEMVVSLQEGTVQYVGKEASKYIHATEYLSYCFKKGEALEHDTILLVNPQERDYFFRGITIRSRQVVINAFDPKKQLPYASDFKGNNIDTIFNGNHIRLTYSDPVKVTIGQSSFLVNQERPSYYIIRNNEVVYHEIGLEQLITSGEEGFNWDNKIPQDIRKYHIKRKQLLPDGAKLLEATEGVYGFEFDNDFIFVHSEVVSLEDETFIVDHFKSYNLYKKNWEELNGIKEKLLGKQVHTNKTDSETSLRQKHYIKAYKSNLTIMITGESGVGKSRLAKEIHYMSPLSEGSFVQVNCASIPSSLMESELFGYEKGAFTGANKAGKKGFFDMAYDGTLFLDEISEIPKELQSKLLDALQSKSYYRVGGDKRIQTNARIVVASNKDLYNEVMAGNFREDLYYRICVFPINIQPLRDRLHEIDKIINVLLPKITMELGIPNATYSKEFLDVIKSYNWPGNIRELENILKRALIICEKGQLLHTDWMLPKQKNQQDVTLKDYLETCEIEWLDKKMRDHNGDIEVISKLLGISRSSLYEKLKKYNLGRRNEYVKR